MTKYSRLGRLALTGVCAATIGTGSVLYPATAFALPPSDPGTCPLLVDVPGCYNYSGGVGMIPPATGPYEEPAFKPRPICRYDEELGRRVCDERDGPPPKP